MSAHARIEEGPLDAQRELGELMAEAQGSGAVVSFVGMVRADSHSGARLQRLVLERHPTLTLRSLEEIARSAVERFGVGHVRVVHRCGEIAAGEPIVFAGAAAEHRRAAFETADYLMDRLKTEAVFWKREVGTGGSEWIEPSDADHADRSRWD